MGAVIMARKYDSKMFFFLLLLLSFDIRWYRSTSIQKHWYVYDYLHVKQTKTDKFLTNSSVPM